MVNHYMLILKIIVMYADAQKPTCIQICVNILSNTQMDYGRYLHTACLAVFNMTAVTLAETASLWPLAKWRIQYGYELPTMLTTMWHMVLFVGIQEIGFYYMHR